MIQLNDLRIGNLVLVHNHYIAEVISIGEKIGVKTVGEPKAQIDYLNLEFISAILLNEKWLLDFGFISGYDTKLPYSTSYHLPSLNNEDEVIITVDGDLNYYVANTGGSGDVLQYIGKPFKYVHQLQNIIYFLTQTELNKV